MHLDKYKHSSLFLGHTTTKHSASKVEAPEEKILLDSFKKTNVEFVFFAF